MIDLLTTALLTLALTVLLCFAFAPIAMRFGWVDAPDARKQHSGEIPLVGGWAVFLATLAVLAWLGGWSESTRVLAWSSAIVFLTGLVDDRRQIAVPLRFGLQIFALLCMVFAGDVVLRNFGNLFWERMLGLGPLAVPITVFSALGVINAFNMIDGLDGLSGSLALVALGGLAFLAGRGGFVEAHTVLVVLFAAVMGFMLMNYRFAWRERARVFLGDAGTSWLGFVMAWFFIFLSQDYMVEGRFRAYAPITAVWLFGLPLLDTTYVMIRRAQEGEPIFGADRRHLHHRFLRSGFTVRQAWAAMTAMAVVMALVGIIGELRRWPEWGMFYGYIGLAVVYLGWMNQTRRTRRFLGRELK